MLSENVIAEKFPFFAGEEAVPAQALRKVVCLRCGRPLSHPDSISRGMGPKCARQVAYETRRKSETSSYVYSRRTESYLSRLENVSSPPLNPSPTYIVNMIDLPKLVQAQPIKSPIAYEPIPECCCCDRHNVRGQLAELVSRTLGRDLFFCTDRYATGCDPRTSTCRFDQFTRPSPVMDFMTLVTTT